MAHDTSGERQDDVLDGDPAPLESVLCTEELNRRPRRQPDHQSLNSVLVTLTQALADSPEAILQRTAEAVIEVLRCDSGALSVLARDGQRFDWPARAGAWHPPAGAVTPRDFSPCGDVIDRDAPLLFRRCERRYAYMRDARPLIEECLLVPLHARGKAVGAVWAIAHDDSRPFDAEDLRQLEQLGRFASAAYGVVESLAMAAEQGRAARDLMAENVRRRQELEVRDAEIRQSEKVTAMQAAVVESSDDAIVSKDLCGIITSWNAGAARLFGYTAQEAIGRSITLIIPPDRIDEEPRVLASIRRGESVDHYETVRRRKDGRLVDVSLTVSPVRDREGRVVGASKIARDITESKRAAEALREADRRKTEFLATLAHELRSPLAPILASLEILRRAKEADALEPLPQPADPSLARSDLSRRAIEAVDVLGRQVGQIARLVDDLLDAGRISRGKIELRKEQVELSAVVEQAVEAVRPLFEEKGQGLTVTLPPTPVHLHADPARLTQIVGNLLHNACKFTGWGGHAWLTVERTGAQTGAAPQGPDGDRAAQAVIRVRDNGIGIPEPQLPKIFDMFAQGDTSLERSSAGLGIGLALARTLTALHGGTIEATSAGAGQGSEFVVTLPVLDEPAEPAFAPAATRHATATLRILVVDDNRDAAESLAVLLGFRGHETHTAHDGLAALEATERFDPDVVLLDLGLPGLNGYEAARRIRESRRDEGRPLLVALTGRGQAEDRRRSEDAGFDAHVVKPVDDAALVELLARLGAGRQPQGR